MKFIVFNIVVAISISYLIFSQPGQSIGSWVDSLIGRLDNQIINQVETSKNKNISEGKIEELPSKNRPEEYNISELSKNKIKEIALETVHNSLEKLIAKENLVKTPIKGPSGEFSANELTAANSGSNETKPNLIVNEGSHEPLETAFNELYPNLMDSEVKKNNVKVTADTKRLMTKNTSDKPAYMTNNERQIELGNLIENLQLTYLNSTGK